MPSTVLGAGNRVVNRTHMRHLDSLEFHISYDLLI